MNARSILVCGLLAALTGAAGCQSVPTDTMADARANADAESIAAADIDRKVAEAAKGFTRIERDGEVYFCKRSRPMGSNIPTLKCMTEAQLRTEVETTVQYRDDLRNRSGKCTAGRAGQGGPCGGY